MEERKRKGPGRAGCALIALVALAAILAIGAWVGQRQDSSRTPCERYARAVIQALDNCHSGVNRDREHHQALCERGLAVTDACLEEIEELSRVGCSELESRVSSQQLCRE